MTAAAEAGLDKQAAYRLALAVDEIATNIVVHGYDEAGREGVINAWADIDEQALRISLEDTGVTYDPRQASLPGDLDVPLEQRTIGGLGLYLAVDGCDELLYERVDDRNRTTFIVKRVGAASEA